jgi:hypothetical protein
MKDNENLIKFGQEIYSKHPALSPFSSFIKKFFLTNQNFLVGMHMKILIIR